MLLFLKKNERKFLLEEEKKFNFFRTLFLCLFLSLSLKGPLSHHDFERIICILKRRSDDEKKALLLFLSSLFLRVCSLKLSLVFLFDANDDDDDVYECTQ